MRSRDDGAPMCSPRPMAPTTLVQISDSSPSRCLYSDRAAVPPRVRVAPPDQSELPGAHQAQVLGVELGPVVGGEGESEAVLERHMGGVLPTGQSRPHRRLLLDHLVICYLQFVRPKAGAKQARQVRGGDGLLQDGGAQPRAGADGRDKRVEGRS